MTLRPFASRTSFAGSEGAPERGEVRLRQRSARPAAAIAAIALAPLAALAAVVAGAVFVVLLPVCGIASIAEGVSRRLWRAACDPLTHHHSDIVSHH